MQDYFQTLADAGLLVERLREPVPSDDAVARNAAYRRWQRVPMFLFLRAVKTASESAL